jgi:hypothetical protein
LPAALAESVTDSAVSVGTVAPDGFEKPIDHMVSDRPGAPEPRLVVPPPAPANAVAYYRVSNGSTPVDIGLSYPWDLSLWLRQNPGWFVVSGPTYAVPGP